MSVESSTNHSGNVLPDDVFDYNHEKFYDFVKSRYGTDLSELFMFQAIRNGAHLLNTTLDDILSFLQYDSVQINKLKELCCFPVGGNRFEVKLGVKLAIKNFILLLNMKEEQEKKKKKPRVQYSLVIDDTSVSANQNSSKTDLMSSLNMPLTHSSDDEDETRTRMKSIEKNMSDVDHILDIKHRISKWGESNGFDSSPLEHGVHYSLEINKSINDTYVCVLSCRCKTRFKLPFTDDRFFKLSSFYRHLKEKKCRKANATTTSDDDSTDNDNQISKSSISFDEVSGKNKATTNFKRDRSISNQSLRRNDTKKSKKL